MAGFGDIAGKLGGMVSGKLGGSGGAGAASGGSMGFQGGTSSATNGDQTNGGLHTAGVDMGAGKNGIWQNILLVIVVLAVVWLLLG